MQTFEPSPSPSITKYIIAKSQHTKFAYKYLHIKR